MDLSEKESIINDYCKEIFEYEHNHYAFKYIDIIFTISWNILNSLQNYCDEINSINNSYKMDKYSIMDRINYAKNYYRDTNRDIDIDNLINTGIIDFFGSIYENNETVFQEMIKGTNDSKNLININNTGTISDSKVLVHEISHYIDNPLGKRNITSDLLTEALAFIEELLFIESIKNKDLELYKYLSASDLINFYNIANVNYPFFKFMNLYDLTGEVNIENCKLLYGYIDNYEDNVDWMVEGIMDNLYEPLMATWYMIACLLSYYMLDRYKDDNNYIEVIKSLHEDINKYDELTVLNHMGLYGNLNEMISKTVPSLEKHRDYILNLDKKSKKI